MLILCWIPARRRSQIATKIHEMVETIINTRKKNKHIFTSLYSIESSGDCKPWQTYFEISLSYNHLDPELHGLENVIHAELDFFLLKNHRGEIYYYVNKSDNKVVLRCLSSDSFLHFGLVLRKKLGY